MCALRRIYDIYTGMYKSQDKDNDLQGMSILPMVFILHALTLSLRLKNFDYHVSEQKCCVSIGLYFDRLPITIDIRTKQRFRSLLRINFGI